MNSCFLCVITGLVSEPKSQMEEEGTVWSDVKYALYGTKWRLWDVHGSKTREFLTGKQLLPFGKKCRKANLLFYQEFSFEIASNLVFSKFSNFLLK